MVHVSTFAESCGAWKGVSCLHSPLQNSCHDVGRISANLPTPAALQQCLRLGHAGHAMEAACFCFSAAPSGARDVHLQQRLAMLQFTVVTAANLPPKPVLAIHVGNVRRQIKLEARQMLFHRFPFLEIVMVGPWAWVNP